VTVAVPAGGGTPSPELSAPAVDPVDPVVPVGARARTLSRAAGTWPVSVVAMAVAVVVGAVKVISTYGQTYYHYGDQAVLGLRVIEATHFDGQLGPYSRFGWSHPGPALFYLLAPVYRLSGNDPRALIAGSLLINGACLVATVAVVRRFAGEWSARWSVAVVGAMSLALGVAFFETFWNPNLEAAPLLLAMALAAAAAAGSGLSVVWLGVVGSYMVQTDVGTTLIVAVLAVVAVAGWAAQAAARKRRDHPRVGGGGPVATTQPTDRHATVRVVMSLVGLAVVVAMWVPPLVQQADGHPGNLSAVFHFFTTSSTKYGVTHSLAQAWATVANSTTVIPFGSVSATASMTTTTVGREVTLVVWLGLAAVGVAWSGWRRVWFAFGLAVASLAGLAASVASAERIVGPINDYLVFWMALVPAPALVALGVLVVDQLRRRAVSTRPAHARPRPHTRVAGRPPAWRTVAWWVLAGALVVPGLLVAAQWAPGSPAVGSEGDTEIGQLSAFASSHLGPPSGAPVLVVIGNANRWPEAAGLILQLTREGYHPVVTPLWEFMFTARLVRTSTGQPQLVLTDPTSTPSAGATASGTFATGDVPTTISFVPAPVG
jgi:hypothetical protein